MDLCIFCAIQVNDVCDSVSMRTFSDCAYQRSRYYQDAPPELKLEPPAQDFCPAECVTDENGVPTMIYTDGTWETNQKAGKAVSAARQQDICAGSSSVFTPRCRLLRSQYYNWKDLVCKVKISDGNFRDKFDPSFCEWFSTVYGPSSTRDLL